MVKQLYNRPERCKPSRKYAASQKSNRLPPQLPGQWRLGMPCHWNETTAFNRLKFFWIRFLSLAQLVAGFIYLKYRLTNTICVINTGVFYAVYQGGFFLLELFGFLTLFTRIFENWNITMRNSVDFKRIPQKYIAPRFHLSGDDDDIFSEHKSQSPTVDVLIPCYNEDIILVQGTIMGALKIDYPSELLNIYLCDDGNDPSKQSMVNVLRRNHPNLHYVTRPQHKHAKAGNLNYTLGRTSGDLIVTLDADFVARPNLLQRLIPYYFVWNPAIEMYEFDRNLAAVQAPQHFRNISAYDTDPTDQRATYFMEFMLPAKDWFNGTPLIGTTNLLNRDALTDCGYYPCYTVTEDSAMSLKFHQRGYSTYYVNESLATGLATTSLWGSFDQRERWLKGDWQILFSKEGPVLAKGLTIIQRIMYINMSSSRILSLVHILYEISCILLLFFGIQMVDVVETWVFLSYFLPFFILGIAARICRVIGNGGLVKSDAAALSFETMFRFVTIKGLISVLLKGQNIKFKVTDKPSPMSKGKKKRGFDREWLKNLERAWFNILMGTLLCCSIIYGLSGPAWLRELHGTGSPLPLSMAIGFSTFNLIPHILCIYLCFVPVLSGWTMKDLVHGRCDQYAVDPYSGKKFVPSSFITLFAIMQIFMVFVSIAFLAALTPRSTLNNVIMSLSSRQQV